MLPQTSYPIIQQTLQPLFSLDLDIVYNSNITRASLSEHFWKEVLSWLAILNNEIVDFSLIDVLFGKFDIDEGFIVINHILLLAKFYIYRSKLDNTKPSLEVFKTKLKAIFNIEFLIAKRNGKLAQHYKKWDSFISVLV